MQNQYLYLFCMKKNTLLILLLLNVHLSFSQNVLRGIVIESDSRYPISFATVVYYESGNPEQKGVVTDAFGNFEVKSSLHIQKIRVSCVGYKTEELKMSESDYKKKLVISLDENPIELNQVVVTTKNNPALRIIRNALYNKSKNDFIRYPEYSYTAYVKTLIDYKTSKDSTNIEKRQYRVTTRQYFEQTSSVYQRNGSKKHQSQQPKSI